MKASCIVVLSLLAGLPLIAAEKPRKITASALLDEAIQRPGDFDQICDAGRPVPYEAPPIAAYGLTTPQPFFLSEEMKKHLKEHRAEIVKEMATRLEKLDWTHPPAAPKLSKKPMFPPNHPVSPDGEGDPSQPSGQNPRTLTPIMLTVIVELDATELLPQLLKLESALNDINVAALKSPEKGPIAKIDLGMYPPWNGMEKEFEGVEDVDKSPKLKHKIDLFQGLVLQREILGTVLEELHRKGYAPLKESTFGKAHAEELKSQAAKDETLTPIKSAADLAKSDLNDKGVAFDSELGVPYWRWEHGTVPYTESTREEARKLVQRYIDSAK